MPAPMVIIYWAITINFIWLVIITVLVVKMIRQYKIDNSRTKKGGKRDVLSGILMEENERLMDIFIDFAKELSKK